MKIVLDTNVILSINLQTILDLVEKDAEFFAVPALPEQVCSDPDDDKFLACALASGAKVIVSGDKHLLKFSGYGGIQVFCPRAFVETYLLKGQNGNEE
jgi:predicted nucleic acid-binding protein